MTATRQKAKAAQRLRSAAARASRLMPSTGKVDDLAESLAADQGRSIRMLTEDLGPREPSGMWIATEKADWIGVPNGVGSAQRTAIICHELALEPADGQPRHCAPTRHVLGDRRAGTRGFSTSHATTLRRSEYSQLRRLRRLKQQRDWAPDGLKRIGKWSIDTRLRTTGNEVLDWFTHNQSALTFPNQAP